MLLRLIGAAALSLALLQGAAFAGDKDKSAMDKPGTTGMSQQGAQNLPQDLESKLKAEGFTDVEVVPGSYFVSAKDKDGDPVHAVITPNSMTIVSMSGSESGAETTGSGAGSGAETTGSGAGSGMSTSDDAGKN